MLPEGAFMRPCCLDLYAQEGSEPIHIVHAQTGTPQEAAENALCDACFLRDSVARDGDRLNEFTQLLADQHHVKIVAACLQ